MDELNVKEIVMVEDDTELSEVSYKPNFRSLGPRFGKRMGEVTAYLHNLSADEVVRLNAGEGLAVAGGEITIDDVEIQRREREDVLVAFEDNLGVGLDIHLSEELILEGNAREIVNRIQSMRKEAELAVTDRIRLSVRGEAEVMAAVEQHRSYVCTETLALDLVTDDLPAQALLQRTWDINAHEAVIALEKAT